MPLMKHIRNCAWDVYVLMKILTCVFEFFHDWHNKINYYGTVNHIFKYWRCYRLCLQNLTIAVEFKSF